MNMLEVSNLSISFGGLKAVSEFNLTIKKGQLYGLIGPNGAGKTTTLRAISGLIRGGQKGSVLFEGKEILGLSAHKITGMGIAQCLEGRQVFSHLTVRENLQMGAFLRKDTDKIKQDYEYVYSLFPRLKLSLIHI